MSSVRMLVSTPSEELSGFDTDEALIRTLDKFHDLDQLREGILFLKSCMLFAVAWIFSH